MKNWAQFQWEVCWSGSLPAVEQRPGRRCWQSRASMQGHLLQQVIAWHLGLSIETIPCAFQSIFIVIAFFIFISVLWKKKFVSDIYILHMFPIWFQSLNKPAKFPQTLSYISAFYKHTAVKFSFFAFLLMAFFIFFRRPDFSVQFCLAHICSRITAAQKRVSMVRTVEWMRSKGFAGPARLYLFWYPEL